MRINAYHLSRREFFLSDTPVRHFGLVIGIRPEFIDEYRSVHNGPGVRDLLTDACIRNFNIFLQQLPDGEYYEYVGDDYETDMTDTSTLILNNSLRVDF